jgi:hypothetical protein
MNQVILVTVFSGYFALSQLLRNVEARNEEHSRQESDDVIQPFGNSALVTTSIETVTIVYPFEPKYTYIHLGNAVYPLLLQSDENLPREVH